MMIYDGDLQIDEAAAELLRIEKAQHDATRDRLRDALSELAMLRSEAATGYGPIAAKVCEEIHSENSARGVPMSTWGFLQEARQRIAKLTCNSASSAHPTSVP